MQRQEPCSPLLSLPTLPLMAVIDCLSSSDKLSLFCTCWTLATAVTATSPEVRVKVTSETGWKGLSKVLVTVTCKPLSITSELSSDFQPDEDNAVAMLLKSEPVPGCSFHEIKKVELTVYKQAPPLPCLLPSSLASMLPDLKELSIHYHSEHSVGNLQPIPYCSSLCKISINYDGPLQRIVGHYNAQHIRRQLSNVTSLEIEEYETFVVRFDAGYNPKGYVDRLLRAWGSQLAELVLDIYEVPDKLQLCTELQSLTCEEDFADLLLRSPSQLKALPLLTHLKLATFIPEAILRTILQLPMIRLLTLRGFQTTLEHDWSNHPCTWQQLNLERLDFVDLGKLPLRSMKGYKGVYTEEMELSDPLLPGSLATVKHAAKCVSDAGIIVTAGEMVCDLWYKIPGELGDDAAFAAIVHSVARVVRYHPLYMYSLSEYATTYYPQSTTALVRWLSNDLCDIFLTNWSLQPWFWQALQCCQKLQTVTVYTSTDIITAIDKFAEQSQLIAEQLVVVTRRAVTAKLQCRGAGDDSAKADALQRLKVQLQVKLPRSVVLKDVSWAHQMATYDVVLVPASMGDAVDADGGGHVKETKHGNDAQQTFCGDRNNRAVTA